MTDKGLLVRKEISPAEPCLRCVYLPMHISSKGSLQREAMLPPSIGMRNDVSLLRQEYMSVEECVEHGKRIGMRGQTFTAVASVRRQDVLDVNAWAATKDTNGNANGTSADIFYAPMANGEYVDPALDVYTKDMAVDLPAHADMRYGTAYNKDVQTRMRQYASELVKRMNVVYTKP